MRSTGLLLCAALVCATGQAAVEAPNQVKVTVEASVSFDRSSGLYSYAYEVYSAKASRQEVDQFSVRVPASRIVNILAPRGWSGMSSTVIDMVLWCACEEDGITVPPGHVDDGQPLPSVFQIKPGHRLGGFTFQSPDPPSRGVFYAGGFVRIPVEGVAFAPGKEPYQPDFPHNHFEGVTWTPRR